MTDANSNTPEIPDVYDRITLAAERTSTLLAAAISATYEGYLSTSEVGSLLSIAEDIHQKMRDELRALIVQPELEASQP